MVYWKGVFLNSILGWLISPLKMANKVNVNLLTEFNKISNKKSKKKLNYQFIPLEESLAFHLENYKKTEVLINKIWKSFFQLCLKKNFLRQNILKNYLRLCVLKNMENQFLGNQNFNISNQTVTAICPKTILRLNQILGKYANQIPANPSISYTLNHCNTQTSMEFFWQMNPFFCSNFLAGNEEVNLSKKSKIF